MTDPKSLTEPNDTPTPEDVATLYSWANLHGAKYRDFSASRAAAREEARLRAEEAAAVERRRLQEEAERIAQEEAQIAARLAAEAAEAARQAEAERLAEIARQAEAERQAVLAAQEAQRQAAQQRAWQPAPPEAYDGTFSATGNPVSTQVAGKHPEAGLAAEVSAERIGFPANPAANPAIPGQAIAGQGIADPAQRASTNQPPSMSPAAYQDPYRTANQPAEFVQPGLQSSPVPQYPSFAVPPASYRDYPVTPSAQSSYSSPDYPVDYRAEPFSASPWSTPETRETREMATRPAWLAPELPEFQPPPVQVSPVQPRPAQTQFRAAPQQSAPQPVYPPRASAQPAPERPYDRSLAEPQTGAYPQSFGQPGYGGNPQASQPAFQHLPGLGAAQNPVQNPIQTPAQSQFQYTSQNSAPEAVSNAGGGPVDDTLLGSRDRIANRWYALKSVFDPQAAPVEQVPQPPPARVPVLAVFSLAGGVGKTSLIASLGRALSSRGERVLLVDTAPFGLLPFFFGARDQRPGMLRTFNPPGATMDAPVQLVTLDPEGHSAEPQNLPVNQDPNQSPSQVASQLQSPAQNPDWLAQEVARLSRGVNRILVDLPTASGATTRRALRMGPVVLVPVAPDMNSVVSVGAIESFFRSNANGVSVGGKPIMPYYVLNQFDYSLPLHLDVREILREQIGDRLLPFALRRSPAVSEALAEGMTVMDYAPTAPVAEDYAHLADWVRSLSAPATQSHRGVRWSER